MIGLSLTLDIPGKAAIEELQTGAISEETKTEILVWNIFKWGGIVVLLIGFSIPFKRNSRNIQKPGEPTDLQNQATSTTEADEKSSSRESELKSQIILPLALFSLVAIVLAAVAWHSFGFTQKRSSETRGEPDYLASLNKIDPTPAEFYPVGTIRLRKPVDTTEASQLAVKISYEQRLVRVSWRPSSIYFLYPDSVNKIGNVATAWVHVEYFEQEKDRGVSEKWQVQFDCNSDRIRWNAVKMHPGNLLTGKVIENTYTFPTDEIPVEPRTSLDQLMKQVCDNEAFGYTNIVYHRSKYCDQNRSNFSCTHDWVLR